VRLLTVVPSAHALPNCTLQAPVDRGLVARTSTFLSGSTLSHAGDLYTYATEYVDEPLLDHYGDYYFCAWQT
jgi:hypothetical protein